MLPLHAPHTHILAYTHGNTKWYGSLRAGIDRLLLGILYMVTYQIGSLVFPHTYLVTPDFRVCILLTRTESGYFPFFLPPLRLPVFSSSRFMDDLITFIPRLHYTIHLLLSAEKSPPGQCLNSYLAFPSIHPCPLRSCSFLLLPRAFLIQSIRWYCYAGVRQTRMALHPQSPAGDTCRTSCGWFKRRAD